MFCCRTGKPGANKPGDKSDAEPVATISKADLAASLSDLKTTLLAEMKKSFDQVNGKLDGLQETVNRHSERLDSLEDDAESLGQRVTKVEACYEELLADNIKLRARLAELEGRSRRGNVRLIGLPENIEGPQPTKFFSQLLQEVFGRDVFPSPPELDRAHRSLAPRPASGGRPRPVILCFHRYQNKELVIREARKRGTLIYQNDSFRIYEDYTPEVVSERKKYAAVMTDLYKSGLRPTLLYPARLRIVDTDGTRIALNSVADAEKFMIDFKARD